MKKGILIFSTVMLATVLFTNTAYARCGGGGYYNGYSQMAYNGMGYSGGYGGCGGGYYYNR